MAPANRADAPAPRIILSLIPRLLPLGCAHPNSAKANTDELGLASSATACHLFSLTVSWLGGMHIPAG